MKMNNKKELEAQGYSIIKIDGVEFLELPSGNMNRIKSCPMLEIEQAMRNQFLESSQRRGKTIEILLPLIDDDKITDLISELYDLRVEKAENKALCDYANNQLAEVLASKKLNSSVKSKCQSKNPRPKTQQKKKPAKKK